MKWIFRHSVTARIVWWVDCLQTVSHSYFFLTILVLFLLYPPVDFTSLVCQVNWQWRQFRRGVMLFHFIVLPINSTVQKWKCLNLESWILNEMIGGDGDRLRQILSVRPWVKCRPSWLGHVMRVSTELRCSLVMLQNIILWVIRGSEIHPCRSYGLQQPLKSHKTQMSFMT